jgi:hypothetical protein
MYSMKYFVAPEQLHDTVADTDFGVTEIVGVEGAGSTRVEVLRVLLYGLLPALAH